MLISTRSATFFCILLLLAAFTGPSWGFSKLPPEPAAAPDKVLVSFHEGVDQDRIGEIVRSVNGTVKNVLATTGVHIIVLTGDMTVADAVSKLSSFKEVRYAEPVERAQPLEVK